MRVLVTGGLGYIGSQMAYDLTDLGEEVVIIDDYSAGRNTPPPGAAVYIAKCGYDWINTIIEAHRIDSIMHFAASTSVSESIKNPVKYWDNNLCETIKLVKTALKCGVNNFIFSSTAAIYGGSQGLVTEESLPWPVSTYAATKLSAEAFLLEVSRANPNFKHASLRYFNVAGADPEMRTGPSSAAPTHLIGVLAQAAAGKRSSVTINGTDYSTVDGTCERDFVHVCDVTKAHYKILQYLRGGGESVTANIGYGLTISVNDVVEFVKENSENWFDVRHGPRREGDIVSIAADSTFLQSIIDWQPEYEYRLDEIIQSAIDWEKKH